MGQMFCVECALVKKTLLEWFNRKFKEIFLLIGKMKNALFANFH